MMDINRTGIFYSDGSTREAASGGFPKTLRARPFAHMDTRFLGLFAGLFVFFGTITFLLSLREPPKTTDDKQISRIQERYAKLVLNKPKPKPKPEKIEKSARPQTQKAPEEKKEKEKEQQQAVPEEKESFVEREKRKAQTREARQKQREEISKQVKSSGIFKAITSTGGGGPSSGIADALGAQSGADELNDLQVSQESFTSAANEPALQKKETRSSSKDLVSTDKSAAARVEQKKVASRGTVTEAQVTSREAEVSSQGNASVSGTSRQCISSKMNRLKIRLKRVYEHWLKRDPALAGLIKIKFVILPSGEVINVSIQSSTSGNARFDQNVIRYIKRIDFSSCAIADRMEIVYPFSFESQK
jgi:TonB family protein